MTNTIDNATMIVPFDLTLFAEGAGGEGATSGTGENNNPLDAARGTAKEVIKYGIQDDAGAQGADVQKTPEKEEAEGENFKDLIKGKYKQDFSAEVQKIINKRFRETETMKAKLGEVQPLLDLLGARYGVDVNDPKALYDSLQSDDYLYERGAEEMGVTVDQFRKMLQTEAENQRMREHLHNIEAQRKMEADIARWDAQATQLKALYPNFDLISEMENPHFFQMLQSGVDVKAAYQAIHFDDIVSGAMQYTAANVAERVANNIDKRSQRPLEGGISSAASVTHKTDVTKLTREDRARIADLVARGENIRF